MSLSDDVRRLSFKYRLCEAIGFNDQQEHKVTKITCLGYDEANDDYIITMRCERCQLIITNTRNEMVKTANTELRRAIANAIDEWRTSRSK